MSGMLYDCSPAVAFWMRSARPELAEHGYARIDIDNLFADPPEDAARCALSCLALAVADIRRTSAAADGMLVLPLPWTETLRLDAPTLNELFDQAWVYGPGLEVPGLYLVNRSVWAAYEPTEIYRRHLDSQGLLPDGYAAYTRRRRWSVPRIRSSTTATFAFERSIDPAFAQPAL
ncbi:MAG: hypothetical protein JWP74_1508 [Marmoricola sp.]|nr:hypothetical protein [Marmoricola sp.]